MRSCSPTTTPTTYTASTTSAPSPIAATCRSTCTVRPTRWRGWPSGSPISSTTRSSRCPGRASRKDARTRCHPASRFGSATPMSHRSPAPRTDLRLRVPHWQSRLRHRRQGAARRRHSRFSGCEVLVLNALFRTAHPTHLSFPEAVAAAQKSARADLAHPSHPRNFHAELEKELPSGIAPAFDGLTVQVDTDNAATTRLFQHDAISPGGIDARTWSSAPREVRRGKRRASEQLRTSASGSGS